MNWLNEVRAQTPQVSARETRCLSGGVAAIAMQLFFSAVVLVDDQILFSARMRCPSSTSQHRTDNDTLPCSRELATAVRHNAIVDSPASSGLWVFQEEPRATSWQHKRLGSVLPQYLTGHFTTRVSPYITTLHTCRERSVLTSLMPRSTFCAVNRGFLPLA